MNIVFNINPLGMEGLGATLNSLIKNCSNPKELDLYFLSNDLKERDKLNINILLDLCQFGGKVKFIDYDAKYVFGHLCSLHGDWTTYGRLLIADHIKDDTALYLDSDLVILTDVLALKDVKFDDELIAAVYGCPIEWSLDNKFFLDKLNWPLDRGYFNAGVVMLNLKKWREDDIETRWKEISNKYPNDLISHDQTLLNALSEGKFLQLSPVYNNPWYPGKPKPENADNSIIHFVGSPKPWDLFGKYVHKGYEAWSKYNSSEWESNYGGISLDKLKRTYKIKNSIVKLAMGNK